MYVQNSLPCDTSAALQQTKLSTQLEGRFILYIGLQNELKSHLHKCS